jgi:hypothetical protein
MQQAEEFLKLISYRLQSVIEENPTALSFPIELYGKEEIKLSSIFLKHLNEHSVAVKFKNDDSRGVILFNKEQHWDLLEASQDPVIKKLLHIFERAASNATALKALWSKIICLPKHDVLNDQVMTMKIKQYDNDKSIQVKLRVIADFLNEIGKGVFEAEIHFPDPTSQFISFSIKKVAEPTESVQQEKIAELLAIFDLDANRVAQKNPTRSEVLQRLVWLLMTYPKKDRHLLYALMQDPSDINGQLLQLYSDPNDDKVLDELSKDPTDINGSITLLHVFLQRFKRKKDQEQHKKLAKHYEEMTLAIRNQITLAKTLRDYINETFRAYPDNYEVKTNIKRLEELIWRSLNLTFNESSCYGKGSEIAECHREVHAIVEQLEKQDPDYKLNNFGKYLAVFMCGLIGLSVLALAAGITLACPHAAVAVLGIITVAGITKASLLGTAAGFLVGFLPGAIIGGSLFFGKKSVPDRLLETAAQMSENRKQEDPNYFIYDNVRCC